MAGICVSFYPNTSCVVDYNQGQEHDLDEDKSMRPRVFIGSSSEGLKFARVLQRILEDDAEVTIWKYNIFRLGDYALESLLRELDSTDFGVFVFSDDDMVKIRGEEQFAARDNVIFEFGLFVGRLGRSRSVAIVPKNTKIRIPSDLWGITMATFDSERLDERWEQALGPAGHDIQRLLVQWQGSMSQIARAVEQLPPELRLSYLSRRGQLTSNQLQILSAIEAQGECSRKLLLDKFKPMPEAELHYRLEQLRLFSFISCIEDDAEDSMRRTYRLSEGYRAALRKPPNTFASR